MQLQRLFKLRTLIPVSLVLAVFFAMRQGSETPSAPSVPAKWSPPVRAERQPLRIMSGELAALPPSERGAALDRLLQQSAHRLTAADAEWLLDLRSRASAEGWHVTTEQWHQFLEHWASARPRDAAEFLEKRGLLAASAVDGVPLLKAWARGDAASILDWVHAGGDERKSWWNHARHTFATAWVEHDKTAALAWVNAGGSEGMEGIVVGLVFGDASRETVASWLKLHSAPDAKISPYARSFAIHRLASLHCQNDGPAAALRWAESLQRADEQGPAIAAILPALTASAPGQAVAWLDRLSSRPDSQPWQAKEAMSKWASVDALAAGEWLNAHHNSPAAPAFIEGYAMSIAGDDPAAARQWIARLPETSAPLVNGHGLLSFGGRLQGRSALENLVRLGEISTLALEDPAQAIELTSALNIGAGLLNYQLTLVRETPGEKPVPRFTPLSPFG